MKTLLEPIHIHALSYLNDMTICMLLPVLFMIFIRNAS